MYSIIPPLELIGYKNVTSALMVTSAISIAVVSAFYPFLLPSLLLFVLATIIAYGAPATSFALLVLLGQVIQFELAPILGVSESGVSIGAMWVRLSDPILLGILISLVLLFLKNDARLKAFVGGDGRFLTLFLIWTSSYALLGILSYGINSIGEFRTYYQYFFVVPYLAVAMNSDKKRIDFFKLLLVLSFAHLLWGVLRGWFLFDFHIGPYDKWLSSFGSLSLLYGLFALHVGRQEAFLKTSRTITFLLTLCAVTLIIVAGVRSVWLAAIVGLIVLWRMGRVRIGYYAKLAVLALPLVLGLLVPIFHYSDVDVWHFLKDRLLAFTDFQVDPTALWRYHFWSATLDQIFQRPMFGFGFGGHFNVFIPEFREAVTTSPHNLYLALLYQIGVVGLLVYVMWVLRFWSQCKEFRFHKGLSRAILMTAGIVIITSHVYGIAYAFEKNFIMWGFIGLGFSFMLERPLPHGLDPQDN